MANEIDILNKDEHIDFYKVLPNNQMIKVLSIYDKETAQQIIDRDLIINDDGSIDGIFGFIVNSKTNTFTRLIYMNTIEIQIENETGVNPDNENNNDLVIEQTADLVKNVKNETYPELVEDKSELNVIDYIRDRAKAIPLVKKDKTKKEIDL